MGRPFHSKRVLSRHHERKSTLCLAERWIYEPEKWRSKQRPRPHMLMARQHQELEKLQLQTGSEYHCKMPREEKEEKTCSGRSALPVRLPRAKAQRSFDGTLLAGAFLLS